MTAHAATRCSGLFGSGLVQAADGAPLRPGGRELTEELLDLAGLPPAARVVDVGCGQGASLEALAQRGCRAVGIDVAPAAIAQARRRTTSLALASGLALPFATGSFDGVLAECSLSTMPDRPAALAEWHRVLRPGGRLAISDVYLRGTGDSAVPLMSRAAIDNALAAAGFERIQFVDRSDVLKRWVAQFIFAHGTLDALWRDAPAAATLRTAALGYFLAIAGKPRRGEPERTV